MTVTAFSQDWIQQFSDPYAVLGISVNADERRISKRYRQIAKQLHPDQQRQADEAVREFVRQTLTKLVNPSYQQLKLDKSRDETLATLRFKARRLGQSDRLTTENALSEQLSAIGEPEVEVFYENALAELSEGQYASTEAFTASTLAISELNLVYLNRKMGVIRQKRTGLVPANTIVNAGPSAESDALSVPPKEEKPPVDYAKRHVDRAKTYVASKAFTEAVRELKDAVRIDPSNSNYHTMLGQVYLMSKMNGMAKVHFRHALKLDPQNSTAQKYTKQLDVTDSPRPKTNGQANGNGHRKSGGFLKFFSRNRATK